MGEAELNLVREQYRATNDRDWEASIALWAEDIVLDVRAGGIRGGVIEGREAVIQWFTEWFTTFDADARFDLEESTELGDGSILGVARHTARGRGSGVEVTTDVVWRPFVEDGRITRQIGHMTREDAIQAAETAN